MTQRHLTVDDIIAKHARGETLTAFEQSVFFLNVRPNGERYSPDADVRDRQMTEDLPTATSTWDRVRANYTKNAAQLEDMRAAAERAPSKTFRSFTLADLTTKAATYRRLSTASDADLAAHFRAVTEAARTRLSRPSVTSWPTPVK